MSDDRDAIIKRRRRHSTNIAFKPPPMPPEAFEVVPRADVVAVQVDPHVAQLTRLSDLLMGAAFADDNFRASEADEIVKVLAEWVDVETLPAEVEDAMRNFVPSRLNIAETCQHLAVRTEQDRFEILELIARVINADDQMVAAESAFLEAVAKAFNLSRERYLSLLQATEVPPLPPPPG